MLTKEYENMKKGISLIVLVITIIVIIILATAVILTLNNNNPINEANRARYESDVANMQAIFTNTVAKVMAQNQCTIKVNAGELNSIKVAQNGVSSVEGRVNYKLDNPLNSSNENGTIVFNTGNNTDTIYYTGKMLPLYNAGETIWYVDSEGIISLKIDEQEYGKGDKVNNPAGEEEGEEIVTSDNPMLQRWGSDFTTDFHAEEYRTKITKVKFATNVKVPNSKIESWDISEEKDGSVMSWVEDDGEDGYILTIAGKEKIIANTDSQFLFYNYEKIKEIENIGILDTGNVVGMESMFAGCKNLEKLDISSWNVSNVKYVTHMFRRCSKLSDLKMSNFKATHMAALFYGCSELRNLDLGNFVIKSAWACSEIFYGCANVTTTLNVTGSVNSYNNMFTNAATISPAKIVLNYTAATSSLVDEMIASKPANSNVVKGIQLD